jgi:hypothetical protein
MKQIVAAKGRLTAVGVSAPTSSSEYNCEDSSAAIWVSSKGSSWQRVSEPTEVIGVELNTVAEYGSKKFVAVGQGCGEAADIVWRTSDNGGHWKPLPGLPKDDLTADAGMLALSINGKDGVVVGTHKAPSGGKESLAWTLKAG